MKVDLFLTTQYPLDQSLASIRNLVLEQLERLETGGFNGVYVGEHHAIKSTHYLLNESVLSFIAGRTETLTVGTFMSLLPLHNPIRLAEFGATVDVLTKGRFRFGVAQGYRDIEYDIFDVAKSRSVQRFTEGLEVIKKAWTEESFGYEGELFEFETISLNPQPVQDPRPPIWAGASNEKSIRRAAGLTDGWMGAHVPLEQAAEQANWFRSERKQHDLGEGTVGLLREVYVAPTDCRAEETVKMPLMKKYSDYKDWNQDDVIEGDRFDSEWDSLKSNRFFVGDPSTVLKDLERQHEKVDLDHLVIRTQFPGLSLDETLQSIQLLNDEVIPVVSEW